MREHVPSHPPTREEIARTIFVGNIPAGVANGAIERLLRAVGSLRRWIRASDSSGKECDFGFAEFEDAESLETAAEILPDTQVPAHKPESDDSDTVKRVKLLVVVDEESRKYAAEWKAKRDESEQTSTDRIEAARTGLERVVSAMFDRSGGEGDDDNEMKDIEADPTASAGGDVTNIPLSGTDDLADIPADVREIVIGEIAAFRERSNKRDIELVRRDDEMGRNHRRNRHGSPGHGANGIPTRPRDRTGRTQPGVKTTDSLGAITIADRAAVDALESWLGSDNETDASDSELENQRQAKKNAELEKGYLDQERRWLNRERSRAAALEREGGRDREATKTLDRRIEAMAKFLREYDDDETKTHGTDDYHRDRGVWVRKRTAFRGRESAADEIDRATERAEVAEATKQTEQARDMADSFLSEQADAIESKRKAAATTTAAAGPGLGRIKLKLGAAAASKGSVAPRRIGVEVEGLLEDGEDTEVQVKRTLRPIEFDDHDDGRAGNDMTEDERKEAARSLAAEIPTEKDGLWAWPIRWECVSDDIISHQLVPFVEKKIVEFLGVQEQMIVDVVEDHVRKHGSAAELVTLLDEVLDEDAEVLVRKLWRMVIFFSESAKRGLSGL